MKLYEIGENEQIQVIAKKDKTTLEYKVTVQMNQQNVLFVEPIMHNNMVVNFQADQVQTDVVYIGEEGMPLLWENCVVKHLNYHGVGYHVIYSDKDGKKYNRRERFRQYVGAKGSLQIDSTREVHEVIVKDISTSGVGFISDNKSLHMADIGAFHLNYQDRDCRLSVQLEGTVVREMDLDDGRKLFGAELRKCNINMNEYVAMKQKNEMAKHHS